MFDLIQHNDELNYKIYQSSFIVDNQNQIIKDTEIALNRFDFAFTGKDSTFFYRYYNFFQMTVGLSSYHKIYKGLFSVIKEYVGEEKPLWIQCWINRHSPETILKRHNHLDTICFGYLSIDPKESETVFDEYVIENKVGQLYIGPNGVFHEVKILKPFMGNRITIGFDVMDEEKYKECAEKYKSHIDINTGYLPI